MKRIVSGHLAIQQGSKILFSDFADDGLMWTGQGARESRHVVSFKEPFVEAPAVIVSISMWDIDHKHNSRADLSTDQITESGFEMVFRTWGDSRIARIRADWTAVGAMPDDDNWDVR